MVNLEDKEIDIDSKWNGDLPSKQEVHIREDDLSLESVRLLGLSQIENWISNLQESASEAHSEEDWTTEDYLYDTDLDNYRLLNAEYQRRMRNGER